MLLEERPVPYAGWIDRWSKASVAVVVVTVRNDPVDTDGEPRRAGNRQRRRHAPAAVGVAQAAAWALAAVVVAGGLGWLYLLRDVGALRHGPALSDALPLEQLAAHSSQPLLLVVVAFVPSGAVAGLVLAYLGRVRVVARVAGLGVLATVLLIADAVVSGAVAQNERVAAHVLPALGHAGVWVEVACIVSGAFLTASARPRARPDAGAAASAG
jgi:hypothetical protein